jgi:hypothetical protein
MADMQTGVGVGAGAGAEEGVLDGRRIIFQVRARVLPASSLPAPNGLAGGGLVGSIFRGHWCVMSTCLSLPRLRERFEQRSGDFGIGCLGASLRSIFNVSCIGHLISHGTPSLHTSSSFSVTPQRRRPSELKTIHLRGDCRDNQSLNEFLHQCHWKELPPQSN